MHKPYKPETPKEDLIRLHNNEGFKQWVNLKLSREDLEGFNVYPDNLLTELKQKLISHHLNTPGIEPEHVVFDVGSAGIIKDLLILHNTLGMKDLVIVEPCFSLYELFAEEFGISVKKASYEFDFSLSIEALRDYLDEGDTLVLTNPNNPTGTMVTEDDIKQIRLFFKGLIIVDEAYIEYAGLDKSLIGLVYKDQNIIVTRSFSKAWALAGARMGYSVVPDQYIDAMSTLKLPYSITSLSIKLIDQALDQSEGLDDFIKETKENEEELLTLLEENNFAATSCNTNFILVSLEDPERYQKELLEKYKIQTRFYNHELTQNYLRISIGTKKQNKYFIESLLKIN